MPVTVRGYKSFKAVAFSSPFKLHQIPLTHTNDINQYCICCLATIHDDGTIVYELHQSPRDGIYSDIEELYNRALCGSPNDVTRPNEPAFPLIKRVPRESMFVLRVLWCDTPASRVKAVDADATCTSNTHSIISCIQS